jgi:hypothetical protein
MFTSVGMHASWLFFPGSLTETVRNVRKLTKRKIKGHFCLIQSDDKWTWDRQRNQSTDLLRIQFLIIFIEFFPPSLRFGGRYSQKCSLFSQKLINALVYLTLYLA